MSERRQDFLARFDWIRRSLMFEPRGHDAMSGGFIFPPLTDDTDAALLFLETSGCLPMCGHGAIGLVTLGLEHGLITPAERGRLRLEVPAGRIEIEYEDDGRTVTSVSIRNVPSFVSKRGLVVQVPNLGEISLDVAYGGNFYAIIEPQGGYRGVDDLGAAGILALSPVVRRLVGEIYEPVHPHDPTIRGVSHVMWADPLTAGERARSAVFYGDHAIDRSPCGTGTSARLAQLIASGRHPAGLPLEHESFIRSRFTARSAGEAMVGEHSAILPVITGAAVATGINILTVDEDRDPLWRGFQVV